MIVTVPTIAIHPSISNCLAGAGIREHLRHYNNVLNRPVLSRFAFVGDKAS